MHGHSAIDIVGVEVCVEYKMQCILIRTEGEKLYFCTLRIHMITTQMLDKKED